MLKTRVIIVARKQRGNPSGKEIQMFNLRYTFAIAEYERDFVSYAEREGINELRPYESGKLKRLNAPE